MREFLLRAVVCVLSAASVVSGESIADVATVSQVIDGDTVVLTDGRVVNLIGIDAPELDQPLGQQAKVALESFVLLRPVTLKSVHRTGWGRYQARLVRDGRWDINGSLVQRGYAWPVANAPASIAPYWSRYRMQAKTARRGIWVAGTPPIAPWQWRRGVRSVMRYSEPVVVEYVQPSTQTYWSGVCIDGT